MSNLRKSKIILTDMFSLEFAQNCVDENDTIRDEQFSSFLKKTHFPNNIYDNKFDFDMLKNYCRTDNFQKIKDIILKKRKKSKKM